MNGVIEDSTGDLIRAGFSDFTAAAGESLRSDVPEPAYIRQPGYPDAMHRWDGAAWVEVAQPPLPTILKFHASSKLVESAKPLVGGGWSELGGVRTSPDFFIKTLAKALGRIVGDSKAEGTGAKIRIIEDDTQVVLASFDIPDSAGAWSDMGFTTTTPPSAGSHVYLLEGDLGTATSASVRFVSMSLLEITP